VTPGTLREQTAAMYEWLRSANPHLPPADKVGADGVSFGFGPSQHATVTLTVRVDMPTVPPPPFPEPEEGDGS
jgi:hypothetical protein